MFYKKWFSILNIKTKIVFIIITGETTIAQKGKGNNQCNETLQNKSGTCNANQCEAACVKRHKPGQGVCTNGEGKNKGKIICICSYQCPRWFFIYIETLIL